MDMNIIRANDEYGDYCLIPVYKNWEVHSYVMVDPEDFEHLSQYKWSPNRGEYAKRSLSKIEKLEKGRHNISMHVQIMREHGLLKGESNLSTNLVDHRNNNRLDNRKLNLRVVNKFQNGWNRGKSKNNTSGYKGVVIRHSEYRAQFHKKRDGKHVTLVGGGYLSAYEASRAYDLLVLANVEFDFIRLNHQMEDYDYQNLTWEGMTLDELKKKGAQDRKNYIALHGKLPVIPKPEKKKVEVSTLEVEEPVFDIFEDPDGLGEYIELVIGRHKMKIKISPEDYPWISEYNWTYAKAKRQGYARRNYPNSKQGIFMHREILIRLGYDMEGLLADHKNRDKHDNRRLNLRPATKAQNVSNMSIVRGEVNYKGVQRYGNNKYISLINRGTGKTQEPLIITDDPIKAAMAYDLAALEIRGEFAAINFPDYDYSGMTLKQFLWDHRVEKYDSGYKGVHRCNKDPLTWIAGIAQDDSDVFLGRYETEEDAAIAYDLKELELRGKTSNFSPDNYPDGKYQGMTAEQWAERKLLERHIKRPELARKQRLSSSGYIGVHKHRSKWSAYFLFNWEKYSTGKLHLTAVEAAIEVDRLRLDICREWAIPKLNFPLSDYADLVEAYNLYEFLEMIPNIA